MNDLITKKDQKTRKVLIVLSIFSLVFMLLNILDDFFGFKEIILDESYIAHAIIYMLSCFLTHILLIVFVTNKYESDKFTVYMPIILALAFFRLSLSIIHFSISIGAISFGLAAVCSFAKISNKTVFIITSVLCLVEQAFSIGIYTYYILDENFFSLNFILELLSICLFCIVWLIIGIKSKIPSVIAKKPEADVAVNAKQNVQNSAEGSLEKRLQEIEEQHNLGLISDEEYKLKRSEIINKL